MEASSRDADVRLEGQVQVVGCAVQQLWDCCTCVTRKYCQKNGICTLRLMDRLHMLALDYSLHIEIEIKVKIRS